MPPMLETAGYLALLALGFGFVVFWHELGHFLAAKWAGVRVEQFAVGFAHAVFSWRKGMGVRFGSSQKEYRRRIYDHLGRKPDEEGNVDISDLEMRKAGEELGLGETEYRLNWLPLGGYVKMLGQDDLRPNSEADDPKAYNRQSVGKRMVIVSAGVIMNVILAAIGFMILFSIGFNVPPTKVGSITPGSPAQLAGIQVGDQILELDGKQLYNDYTKLQLNAALSASGEPIPVKVLRTEPDGSTKVLDLTVTPMKTDMNGVKLVGLGVGAIPKLAGIDPEVAAKLPEPAGADKSVLGMFRAIKPGDVITAVDGQPVDVQDYPVLDRAFQKGEPVTLTIRDTAGNLRQEVITPTFASPFDKNQIDILGMVPRQQISAITPDSPVYGKAQAGDVLLAIRADESTDRDPLPTFASLSKFVNDAANNGKRVKLTVLRDGKPVELEPITPVKIRRGVYGVGVGLMPDESGAVVADVLPGSAAAAAGLAKGATVTAVGSNPVENWRQVHTAIRGAISENPGLASVELSYRTEAGEEKTTALRLGPAEVAAVQNVRYVAQIPLADVREERIASSALEAVQLGTVETRDFILQFYVTLKRMVTRDVSPDNLMGPIGIFQTGTTIASRGGDWLLWFLSMISANLAVVNFLPIPIVDGGLFLFLLIEKIKGRPASPRTQIIAQYVGLVLLLSIFLFVTYQDIANFAFR